MAPDQQQPLHGVALSPTSSRASNHHRFSSGHGRGPLPSSPALVVRQASQFEATVKTVRPMLNRPQAHGCFLRVAPEGRLLSSKPQQGASAALDEPFGITATAADQAAAKLKPRQGIRLSNATEPQVLHELALRWRMVQMF